MSEGKFQPLPTELAAAIVALSIENPSDRRIALEAVTRPEDCTKSTIKWLQALVERGGVRYCSP